MSDDKKEISVKDVVTFILHSIGDTQNTIKNLDVKAQVLSGVFGLLLINSKNFIDSSACQNIFALLSFFVIFVAMLVLFPKIKYQTAAGSSYFVGPGQSPNELADKAMDRDWVLEAYSVLVNVSNVRESKIAKLHFAYVFACAATIVALVGVIPGLL